MRTLRMALAATCLVGVSALGTATHGQPPEAPAVITLAPAASRAVAKGASNLAVTFPPRLQEPEGEWLRRADGTPIWRVTIHQQCLVLHGGKGWCPEYEAPQRLHADLQPLGPGGKPGAWLIAGTQASGRTGGEGGSLPRSPLTLPRERGRP